jgi:hypothetical protein
MLRDESPEEASWRRLRETEAANREPFALACEKHLKPDYKDPDSLFCVSLIRQAIDAENAVDRADLESMLDRVWRWGPSSIQSWLEQGVGRFGPSLSAETLFRADHDDAEFMILSLFRALTKEFCGAFPEELDRQWF